MPIYEYRCQSCGHELEKLQKISDEPLKDCPECAEPALIKKISAAGFRLKGQGWYETDFKTGDKKKNLAGDKSSGDGKAGDSKSSDSSASSKSESKSSAANGTAD